MFDDEPRARAKHLPPDERVLHVEGRHSKLWFGVPLGLGTLGCGIGAGVVPVVIAAAMWVMIAACLVALTRQRIIVTTKHVVECWDGLAALARLLPSLASMEVRFRRAHALERTMEVRREGTIVIMASRLGQQHRLTLDDEEGAAAVAGAVQSAIERAQRRPPSDDQSRLRCPYCHDGVLLSDGTPCRRCGAVHHIECLAIHGGCAVHGCAPFQGPAFKDRGGR